MARRRTEPRGEITVDLEFPYSGLEETRGYGRQRPGTTAQAQNVRTFDPGTDRARGAQRRGLINYYPSTDYTVVNGYAIQNINHLVTNSVTNSASSIGQFIYSLGSGAGFQLGSSGGTPTQWNPAPGIVSGFQFACSCWDGNGNVYVGEVNTTTGAITVYSVVGSTGVVNWTNSGNITGVTSSIRALSGMTVVTNGTTTVLYVAVAVSSSSAAIHQLSTATGAIQSGASGWIYTALNTNFSNLIFAGVSVNCLASIGTLLGIECFGAAGNKQGFMIADTLLSPVLNAPVYLLYGGTAANNRSSVVSDGISTFYSIASVTSGTVKAIGINGLLVWSSTAAGTAQTGLCFDYQTGLLLVSCNATPSVRQLNLASGALAGAGGNPIPAVTNISWIDSDNTGNFTVWRDSVASAAIQGTNATYGVRWTAATFVNTTHSGSSVYKGLTNQPPSASARQIRYLEVVRGELRRFDTTQSYAVSGGKSFSPTAKTIFSTQNGQNMFFADGAGYFYYQSSSDSVIAWAAASGTMPVDSSGTKCRLIATWRGRIVMAGLINDPNNYFMSRSNNAFDWNYSPNTPSGTQPFAGTDADVGMPGDAIMTLIPYKDDTLIMGCDHSIWQMTGDPANGGSLDVISHTLGMAWGRPWAIDLFGQIYFWGNKSGIWKMTPGALPVRISQQIEARTQNVDLSLNLIRMAWDTTNQGLAVWITPYAGGPSTHYFWEERTNAWWPDFYANTAQNPFAVHASDGDNPNQRTIFVGGTNGQLYAMSNTAVDDAGTPINSYVTLGPLTDRDFQEVYLKELKAILAASSGQVTYQVFVGNSPELVLNSVPVESGTWTAGMNYSSSVRRTGSAVFVQLSSSSPWALEKIRAIYKLTGHVNARMNADVAVVPTPAAPTGLAATAASGQVQLAWNFTAGYTYNIYRSTTAGTESLLLTGVSTFPYIDLGVTNGTQYFYKITAVNGQASEGSKSLEVSATPVTGSVPAAPTGVTATAGSALIVLGWTASTGALSYKIYRGTTPAGESATPIATGVATTGYTDTGLSNATAYYYYVKATNAIGDSVASSEVTATTNNTLPPPAPTNLAATAGDTTVALSWTASAAATSYNVYRGTTAGGESGTPVASGNVPTTYSDTGRTNGTTYFYYVKAVNANGTGSQSNEAFATPVNLTVPSAPTLTGATGGSLQVVLTWSANSNTTSYNLYRATTPGGEGSVPVLTGLTGTGTTNTGLSAGTTYYYKLSAVNANGESSLSSEFPATTTATVPAAPVLNTPSAGNAIVTLTWATVTGAATYSLYRSVGRSSTVTITVASPGVVSWTANGLVNGTTVKFATTGALPTGLTAGTTYFVVSTATNTFQVAATLSGAAINTSGTQSGTHTASVGPGLEGSTAIQTLFGGTTIQDSGLTNGTTYYYQLTAVNAAGESAKSNEVPATPSGSTSVFFDNFIGTAGTLLENHIPITGSAWSKLSGSMALQGNNTIKASIANSFYYTALSQFSSTLTLVGSLGGITSSNGIGILIGIDPTTPKYIYLKYIGNGTLVLGNLVTGISNVTLLSLTKTADLLSHTIKCVFVNGVSATVFFDGVQVGQSTNGSSLSGYATKFGILAGATSDVISSFTITNP